MEEDRFTEEDKLALLRCLQTDIEILLEDFEELTGKQVVSMAVKRVPTVNDKYKGFDYYVECSTL